MDNNKKKKTLYDRELKRCYDYNEMRNEDEIAQRVGTGYWMFRYEFRLDDQLDQIGNTYQVSSQNCTPKLRSHWKTSSFSFTYICITFRGSAGSTNRVIQDTTKN